MRIAALDDDEAQLQSVSQLIRMSGHTCMPFIAADALINVLRRESFDLLVLDWNVPDLSGVEIIRWVRRNIADPPPILLLTSRTAEADIVEGLNAGADDYVVKPFQPDILRARIDALLRRSFVARMADRLDQFEGYGFDTSTETLSRDGQSIALTSKEFRLALLLFRNLHRALSRAHILETVWGHNLALPTRTLDVHISRVRTKLDLRAANGFRLSPVYSYGYRLERFDTRGAATTIQEIGE